MISKFLISILILIFIKNNCYGISNNFKFIIDTIGVPQFNVYNDEINENIYYKYNVFCYSSPEKLLNFKGQRFKYNSIGKWTKNGRSGEYYYLGKNYSGNLVANVNFPVDGMPETTPDNWNYLYLSDALSSWNNNRFNNYLQKEYMMNTKMLFDKIDYKNNTINSYELVEYNITPLDIGLDKVVMNTPSTWKTNGTYTVKRKAFNGRVYSAILSSKPMAAYAKLNSKLICNDNCTIKSNNDYCVLNINFGGVVNNLNRYATKDNIKEIVSVLYINDKEISRISKTRESEISKNEVIYLNRNDYNISKTYPLNIKVKSYLYTEFYVDGLLQSEINKVVNLKVENKVKVRSSSLFTVFKENNNKYYLNELPKTDISPYGFIENNRYMGIKINKNIGNNLNYIIFVNNKKYDYEVIYSSDLYDIIKIKINEDNTLKTWNYLRNLKGNYFNINFNEIGDRIKDKNIIKIMCEDNVIYNYFDSIDDFKINYNYIFRKVKNNNFKKYYLDDLNE